MKRQREFIEYPQQEAWVEPRRRVLATMPTGPGIKPAVWWVLGGVLLVAVVNTWVILTQELHPLWSDQVGRAGWSVVTVSGLGCLLILVSSRIPRSVGGILMALGALMASLIPLAASLAPVMLYVNQSGASGGITCYPYVVSHKEKIVKKYVSYDIELTDARGLTKEITVSRDQFDGLLVGVRAHVLVQTGRLGIPYVQQITQVQSASECRSTH